MRKLYQLPGWTKNSSYYSDTSGKHRQTKRGRGGQLTNREMKAAGMFVSYIKPELIRARLRSFVRSFRYVSLRFVTFRYVSLRFVTFRYVSLRFVTFRYVSLRFVTFRYVTFRYVSLRFVTFRYVSLRFVTFRYVSLRFVTFRYVSLRFVTLMPAYSLDGSVPCVWHGQSLVSYIQIQCILCICCLHLRYAVNEYSTYAFDSRLLRRFCCRK